MSFSQSALSLMQYPSLMFLDFDSDRDNLLTLLEEFYGFNLLPHGVNVALVKADAYPGCDVYFYRVGNKLWRCRVKPFESLQVSVKDVHDQYGEFYKELYSFSSKTCGFKPSFRHGSDFGN